MTQPLKPTKIIIAGCDSGLTEELSSHLIDAGYDVAQIDGLLSGLNLIAAAKRADLMVIDITLAEKLEKVEADLRQSEEVFRMIFENAPIMIDSFDDQGNCLLWNNACEKILGWTEAEVNATEDPFSLFYPDPQNRDTVLDNIKKADGCFREYRVMGKSGIYHTQLWADFLLPNGPLISIGNDITVRKQFEEELSVYRDHLEEKVRERTAQLVQVNEQLQREIAERKQAEEAEREQRALAEALRNTSNVLSSTLDIDKVLDNILSNVGQVVPHDAGYILLIDRNRTYVTRHTGFTENEANNLSLLKFTVDETHGLRYVDQYREPCFISNVVDDPEWISVAELAWINSYAGAPIIFGEDVKGLIVLFSSVPDFFSSEQVDRLLIFANQASIAIHNARMYEQAQELAVMEERQRLAREMHDAVSQTLFSASVIAETLPRLFEKNPEAITPGLSELQTLTRGALAEMRTLLVELRPQTLVNTDLSVLIRQLADGLAGRTPVEVTLITHGQSPLATEVKTTFFRIAQEALNNIVKHARASRVAIAFDNQPGQVWLSIQDNGRGFEMDHIGPDRLGLKILHERADLIGAELMINTKIGSGTTIDVRWTNCHVGEALVD